MSRSKNRENITAAGREGTTGAAALAPEVRVVGISRRIWVLLIILTLLFAAAAFAYVRTQGALDTTRTALERALEKTRESEIALRHAIEAKEQAIADKEQLVKELSAQGDKLAEFSRGEEKAKSEAAQAFSGAEAAKKRIAGLKARLTAAEAEITALTAELAVMRTALEKANADVELWRSRAEPYGQTTSPDGQTAQ